MSVCDICGGDFLPKTYEVREMMLGFRDTFTYGECGACGSLQLLDVPDDLARYYPIDYYSMRPRPEPGAVVRVAIRLRAEAAAKGLGRLAKVIGAGHPPPLWSGWLSTAEVSRSDAICDIGCGSGEGLVHFKRQGFRNLTGADAFIPATTEKEGIRILKATPFEVPGTYDFVMLNHSFEHMPDPRGTLLALRRLLNPRGTLMLRLPVAGCFAWRSYGVNWVSLDAPRHLYIPSRNGLVELAARCGLDVHRLVYDSGPEQFWRSEQYALDIPLFDERSYEVSRSAAPFTRLQMANWKAQSTRLNEDADGDTAAFYFRPAEDTAAR